MIQIQWADLPIKGSNPEIMRFGSFESLTIARITFSALPLFAVFSQYYFSVVDV